MATYALKVPDGSDADKFLSEQPNCSGFLRGLVEDYLRHRRGKPGLREPETPAPSGGYTLEDLTEAVYRALKRAAREGVGIVQGMPQGTTAVNQVDEPDGRDDAAALTADPEATRRAAKLVHEMFK